MAVISIAAILGVTSLIIGGIIALVIFLVNR